MGALVLGEPIDRVEVNARVGRGFKIVVRRDPDEVTYAGEYVDLERPRRLVFTWVIPGGSKETTLVTVALQSVWSGVELTLKHERVLPEDAARVEQSWGEALDALAAIVSW